MDILYTLLVCKCITRNKWIFCLHCDEFFQATKLSLDELAVNALEGFDDIVGNTVTPSTCSNAYCQEKPKGPNTDINSNGEPQDPDKIFRQYPSFDPVFMKV